MAGLGVAGGNAYGEPSSWQGKEEGAAGSKRGSNDRCKIRQNPYRIRFFQGFSRREHCWGGVEFRWVRWATVQNEIATPLRCTTRGKLARDDSLLRYVAGIFIAPEYKPAAKVFRSPGARDAREEGTSD